MSTGTNKQYIWKSSLSLENLARSVKRSFFYIIQSGILAWQWSKGESIWWNLLRLRCLDKMLEFQKSDWSCHSQWDGQLICSVSCGNKRMCSDVNYLLTSLLDKPIYQNVAALISAWSKFWPREASSRGARTIGAPSIPEPTLLTLTQNNGSSAGCGSVTTQSANQLWLSCLPQTNFYPVWLSNASVLARIPEWVVGGL